MGCLLGTSHWSLAQWTGRKNDLAQRNSDFTARLPAELQGTVGRLDPFIIDEMVKASKHVDSGFVFDLIKGFPVSSTVSCCGTGSEVPGGQLVHGRRGHGAPPNLDNLKHQCRQINERTIRKARARVPTSDSEWELAHETWSKVMADLELRGAFTVTM